MKDSLDDSLHFPLCIETVLETPGMSSKVMDGPEALQSPGTSEDWKQTWDRGDKEVE